MSQEINTKDHFSISKLFGGVVASALLKASDICLLIDNKGQILDSSSQTFDRISLWRGKNLREILAPESIRKIFSYIDVSSKTLNEKKEALELNHKSDNQTEFAVSYHAHETGQPNQSLLIGKSLKTVTDIQKQLVETQIRLEREYETYRAFDVRYRVILESSNDALLVIDTASLKIQDYNEAAKKYFSIKSDNLKALQFSNFFPEISPEELTEYLRLNAENFSSANSLKSIGGQRVAIRPTFFRSGADLLAICKVEPEVSGSSEAVDPHPLLKEFYEKCPDSIVITTENGIIYHANERFLNTCNILNFSNLEGKSFEDFLERGTVDLRVLIETLKSEDIVGSYFTKLRCAHGTNVNVEISASKMKIQGNSFLGFILRTSNKGMVTEKPGDTISDKALENSMKLVGSAPLKDLVSDTSDVVERICIKTALELTRNNRVAAAEMLSLSRQSLYIKLRKYGLLKK